MGLVRLRLHAMRFLTCVFIFIAALSQGSRGEWISLPWPALGATLPIWKPDDFDASKKYPAIVYFHGTGGEPNASFIHKATGRKSYILVGMAYRNKDRYTYTDEEISDELGLLGALKKTLVGSLSVDPQRIYVAGFSKGGWHSAMLLDYDRDLAGGLVLGGGVFKERGIPVKFKKPTPIYIGCGRFDGNYPPSIAALVYFRKLGADPTLEAWPEMAHAIPEETPEGMRQWLRIQANEPDLRTEATAWIENRQAECEGIENLVAQWIAYEEFISLPFVKEYGAEAAKMAGASIETLLKNPTVAAEEKWRKASRQILVRESRDRLVNTLQASSRAHQELAGKAMGTLAGAEAQRDFERTQKLLETADVVTLPAKGGGVETITPVAPPTAPSGNTDRGPFFPPGIKVKPAD